MAANLAPRGRFRYRIHASGDISPLPLSPIGAGVCLLNGAAHCAVTLRNALQNSDSSPVGPAEPEGRPPATHERGLMYTDTESDAAIVRQTLAGNRHAFEALIRRYHRMAYAVAFARLGNHQDTEDAVQEAWIQAFTALDHLREPDRFAAWLASIVRHISLNATRNRWRVASIDALGAEPVVDTREPMEAADIHRALWAQVQTLSPEHREVLTLHYHAGLSTEEIAESTGTPREAVKKRLQRARSGLSEQTLHTLFEPAARDEDHCRKRAMAAVLALHLDRSPAPAPWTAPLPRLAAPRRTIAAFGRDWSVNHALATATALLLVVTLVAVILAWALSPSRSTDSIGATGPDGAVGRVQTGATVVTRPPAEPSVTQSPTPKGKVANPSGGKGN